MVYIWVSYLWGKSFLSLVKIRADLSSSVLFGFIAVLFTYQVFYLPFFLSRGSYRIMSFSWLAIATLFTIYLFIREIREKDFFKPQITRLQAFSACTVSALVIFTCVFTSLHVPGYGSDIDYYISTMNMMYNDDVMWINSNGVLNIHNGSNSLFGLMTIPSLITGIRPYYLSVFTMRILLVVLAVLTVYRIGKIVFANDNQGISQSALWMSAFVVMLLMFWNSMYQPHFFFRRSNEAKAYCQFILHPLAFSIFLQMCKENENRKALWKEQVLVGLSAVAVSMSSLTAYPLLVFVGCVAILAYDRFNGTIRTSLYALLCAAPNLLFAVFFFLVKKGYFVF